MQRYLLVGTAGHIDHGKTSLIKSLTGVDTDRLPEEKRRGITVDLGFAALEIDDLLLGVVDVPGHERFIKNMLAGATGVDLAILVVAADEGVMPQTREHFEALRYLNVSTGVVAITKCDLVDHEMLELVEEEISQLVADSFLHEAPMIRVSAKTGDGLAELRRALAEAAGLIPPRSTDGPFKMSIDRCFSAQGQGTVVTGSVVSGKIACGEQLQLLPQETLVTVRQIESHGRSFERIGRGQRAALNLAGVHYRDVARGDLLVTAGSIAPSRLLSVRIEASQFLTRPLKSRTDIRFYCGATETTGRLRLLESKTLAAGDWQIGQVELQQSIFVTWGESFVVRGLAANEVIGGGQIIDPIARRVSPKNLERVESLRELTDDAPTRVAAATALWGARSWAPEDLLQKVGVTNEPDVLESLVDAGVLCRFNLKGTSRWLHRDTVAQLEARLLQLLTREHQHDRLSAEIPIGRLSQHFAALEPPELLTYLAQRMAEAGQLRIKGEHIALADWQPMLTANQTTLLKTILTDCEAAGLTPPSVGEFAAKLEISADEVEALLRVAVASNDLTRLPDRDSRDAKAAQRARLYLHCSAEQQLMNRLLAQLADSPEWTISQFAEVMDLSRKYAIPLCNHLDQTGVTAREGDFRKLVQSASTTS